MPIKRSPRWLYYGILTFVLLAAFGVSLAVGSKLFASKVKTVSIYDDGQVYEIRTMESKVGNILEQANIDISENDYINMNKDEVIDDGTKEIFIRRAVPVTISVDGKKVNVYTLKNNVQEVLDENKITLSSLDRIKEDGINLTSDIRDNMTISIVRVTDKLTTEELNVPYQVIRKENSNMSIGDEKVVNSGSVGKRVKTYRLLYEDGAVVDKDLVKDETIAKPVNKVIEYGIVKTFMSNRGIKVQYSKEYTMKATAYTIAALTNRPKDHPNFGMTASGKKAQVGIIAVDTSVIPMGTKLYVEGLGSAKDYGYCIAGDTGGFNGNVVDLYFNSLSECYKWGRRNVKVYVLKDQSLDIFKMRKDG